MLRGELFRGGPRLTTHLIPETLVLVATLAWGASGVPGLFLPVRPDGRDPAHALSTALGLVGSALAVAAAVLSLSGVVAGALELRWPVPFGVPVLSVDALSAVFVLPVAVVSAAGAVYGRSYWPSSVHPRSGPWLRFWYGLLTAAMLVVMTARHGLFFLFAWEIMAVAAFFLVSTEHEKQDVRRAGWIYLVSAHVGALFLFAMVALLALRSGSYDWAARPTSTSTTLDTAIFACGLVGFALKAGVTPFHFWLPGAHANSPSHVSAMLSGVMLKTGVYGVLRLTSLVPTGTGAATVVLVAGAFSAVYGIAMALGQADYKRTLAYSSIEHIGIIFLAIGLALLGRATGEAPLVVLGLTAALLHTWNHALFKSLLFLGAGAVLHATGTRAMDRLGGLWPKMPRAAAAVLVGVVSAAGLPPLNGFASEWLLYLGLFAALGSGHGAFAGTLGVPVLALVGGLALATFAKLFGTVFLGAPRTEVAARAHAPSPGMTGTLAVLAGGCVAASVASPLLVRTLAGVVGTWAPGVHADALALAPLGWISLSAVAVALAGAALFAVLSRRIAHQGVTRQVTWDCGFAAPTSRMQYTGRSFSAWLAGRLQPQWTRVQLDEERAQGLFPRSARFDSRAEDPFKQRWYRLALETFAGGSFWLRRFQAGVMNLYLLYLLVTLLAMFAWSFVRPWVLP